jgi:5-methylcytosine-specific restriction endonuclease McrA
MSKSLNKFVLWHQNNIGKTINQFIVGESTNKIGSVIYVLCKCSCGKEKFVKLYNLANNSVISCGHTKYAPEHQSKRSRKQNPQLTTIKRIYKNYKRSPKDDLTLEQFIELSQKFCYYCGSPPLKTYNLFTDKSYKKQATKYSIDNGNYTWNGIDRIDSDLPHTISNCVTCCYICNRAKSDMTVKDFYKWIGRISNNIKDTNE